MGMTPDKFFEAFVLGNQEDCKENHGCVRRVCNAAVSASHLADHYWEYYENRDNPKLQDIKSIGEFIDYLSKQTNDCFRDIRSISNAYKHLYTSIDPKKAVHSSVSSTGAIESITFTDEGVELKKIDDDSTESFGDNNFEPKVMYTRKDGQRIEFLPTLETVINYWESFLESGVPACLKPKL